MNILNKLGQQPFQSFLRSSRFLIRNCSTVGKSDSISPKDKPSYDDILRNRRTEAARSIVVQVNSEKSFSELCNYCSGFGTIINAQHYRISHEDDLHYILLEFSNTEEAAAAIDASSYNEDLSGVPVRSPFLWFKASQGKIRNHLKSNEKQLPPAAHLRIVDGTRVIGSNELDSLLRAAPCIEDQIKILYRTTQLNDLGVRLRFLSMLQVESALQGMFPEANAKPFGSSVNGFGKMGCDLDLILRFDQERVGQQAISRNKDSRLVFHTKENLTNGRSQVQRQMEAIGDMLHLFLPGVCHVRRILQARVPIIKYHHEHLNLEVDLSMSNLTGFYMSELLYMFGELDDRVRPLIFSIRRWAQCCGLTNPSPGRWISNFSLTCLVIFFLQQVKQPILPTINALAKSATPQDIRITEDGVNCTFGRNFQRIGFQSRNTSKINELLLQFFEFYSQFDFHNRAISLNEGNSTSKPDHSAMYIVNPLEQLLNVSKNVSIEECERLRIEVRNAAWILESEFENPTLPNNGENDSNWGLLNLFKTLEKTIIRPNMFFKTRMVEVSELFQTPGSSNPLSSIATPATATAPLKIRNANVRKQVQNIKAQTRSDLRQMQLNAANGSVESAKGRRR